MKINYELLPVKTHFLFFMAGMGPILPFLPVYGKQLGISAFVMGCVTAILPILYFLAKPLFGFIVDYFRSLRKFLFILLLLITSFCYIFMYFIPNISGPVIQDNNFVNITYDKVPECYNVNVNASENCMDNGKLSSCEWHCDKNATYFVNTVYFYNTIEAQFSSNSSCKISSNHSIVENNKLLLCDVKCKNSENEEYCLYTSVTFWSFIILMSFGLIGFNVSNSISDAICFDVLGEGKEMNYGKQRVWGSIGFGISALLAGYTIDLFSENNLIKSYSPAFLLVITFSTLDLFCCTKLKLPKISSTENILKDVYQLLKIKPIAIFLCFAAIAGILDSFIIYFLFWYLEDLALITGYMHEIKKIEGLIIFAETLGGEVIFFSLSGKILKKIGYGYTFVFCFFCYFIRFGLISLAPNPWWVIPIEFFMQGPSYALCYTTIVAYASVIAPPGTSATVQGIAAGVDDGFGYAVGSLMGGILYKKYGGVLSLKIFSLIALTTGVIYLILYLIYLKNAMTENDKKNKKWLSPEEAIKNCINQS